MSPKNESDETPKGEAEGSFPEDISTKDKGLNRIERDDYPICEGEGINSAGNHPYVIEYAKIEFWEYIVNNSTKNSPARLYQEGIKELSELSPSHLSKKATERLNNTLTVLQAKLNEKNKTD